VALARGTADYLLLLDADHVVITEDFDPSVLELDMYDIEVRGGITHRMPYLVQGDRPWYYRGKTHEYLTCHEPAHRGDWDGIAVHHHGDGGTRHEKFTRDLALLEEALVDDPDDVRTLFYLAQTRQSLGDHAGALAAFRRRMELGGWDEEIYWSLYQCGVILAERGDWAYAEQAYLAAWEYRPSRAESLYRLAEGARQRGQWHTAVLYADRAAAIAHPNDRLFVESWMYEWGVDFELSIALWWVGAFERGLALSERLLVRADIPEGYRATLEANLGVYRQSLPH
jgi:tetratricopeptide (TPR) repeat protein